MGGLRASLGGPRNNTEIVYGIVYGIQDKGKKLYWALIFVLGTEGPYFV